MICNCLSLEYPVSFLFLCAHDFGPWLWAEFFSFSWAVIIKASSSQRLLLLLLLLTTFSCRSKAFGTWFQSWEQLTAVLSTRIPTNIFLCARSRLNTCNDFVDSWVGWGFEQGEGFPRLLFMSLIWQNWVIFCRETINDFQTEVVVTLCVRQCQRKP